MDLIRLDPSTWLPTGAPITNFLSLIWVEKFFEDSEFELKTYDVKTTVEKMPLESIFSIRQSKEVMLVEKHAIESDENGIEQLTVRGISLTSYLNHRVIGEKRNVKYLAMTNSNLASGLILLYNSFVNNQAWDLTTRSAAYYKNPADAIPNCAITDSTGELNSGTQGPSQQRWLDPGPIVGPVKSFFSERPYGLRMLRPPNSTYKVLVANDGTLTYPHIANMPELCFDVYKGVDRSYTQTVNTPVIFDTEIDDLMLPNYLRGVHRLKTEVHIALNDKAVFADSVTSSGLGRRVMFLDGGDPEEGYDAAAWEAYNQKVATDLLEENKRVILVDGAVSPRSKWKFERDYFLGDYVSVRGYYGALSRGIVSEYIRAYGETGEENYPTLIYT